MVAGKRRNVLSKFCSISRLLSVSRVGFDFSSTEAKVKDWRKQASMKKFSSKFHLTQNLKIPRGLELIVDEAPREGAD